MRPSVDLLVAAVVFDWYGSLNSVRIRYAANQVAHWGISTALDIPCTRWPPRETPNLQYQLHTRPHMLIATVFSSRGLAFRLISLAKSLGLFCVCGRVLWVSIVDGRTISEQSTAIKLIFWHNRLRRHHPGPLAVLCKPWRLEGSLVP